MSRTESSSSVNTFKQCPRKYFYAYKLKLPTKDSLATLAGKAVHDTLEAFFKIELKHINPQKFEVEFEHFLMKNFHDNWVLAVPKMIKLKFDRDQILNYYEDSTLMMQNFLRRFCDQMRQELADKDFTKAFEKLKPQTEVYLLSEKHKVQGYIDALYMNDDGIMIYDYKTSRKDEMTDQYKLQLAIYALLAFEKYGKLPKKICLYFLRQGTERPVEVSDELVKLAEKEVKLVHDSSVSDSIEDYPKGPGPLCNWCDFQEQCFGQKNLKEY